MSDTTRKIAAIFEGAGGDVYDSYQNQFLSDIFQNPFLPPQNSLVAQVDPTINFSRVKACFERARAIYREITMSGDLEPARLYKLGWKEEVTKPISKKLDEEWEKLEKITSAEQLESYLESFKQSTNLLDQVIYKAMLEKRETIQRAVCDMRPAIKQRLLGRAYVEARKNVGTQAEPLFFKSDKSYRDLQQIHAVYDPKDDGLGNVTHSWGTNLAWALAHIRRGNTFIVCSNILANQTRSKYQDTPCALAREICVALKAGYTLCKDERGITLQLLGLKQEYLRSCDSTGAPGDGVNPSFEEIEKIYHLLKSSDFDSKATFQCHFNFSDGKCEFVEGARTLIITDQHMTAAATTTTTTANINEGKSTQAFSDNKGQAQTLSIEEKLNNISGSFPPCTALGFGLNQSQQALTFQANYQAGICPTLNEKASVNSDVKFVEFSVKTDSVQADKLIEKLKEKAIKDIDVTKVSKNSFFIVKVTSYNRESIKYVKDIFEQDKRENVLRQNQKPQ
jgi:hypothetical protein